MTTPYTMSNETIDQIVRIRTFNRFYTNLLGLLDEKLLGTDISLAAGRILFEIDKQPSCTATDLSAILRIDKGYLSRTLSKMEKSGLITKRTSKNDKRAKNIALTSDGREMLFKINQEAITQINSMLAPIGKIDRQKLVSAMTRIERILSPNGGE